MNKSFISIILFLSLHLIGGEASAQNSVDSVQNKIDSIRAEVEALNKYYHQRMTAIYKEMLDLSLDKNLNPIDKMKAQSHFHLFPIEESINLLLDNVHIKWFTKEKGEDVYKRPFSYSLEKIIRKNGLKYPAVMKKLLEELDQPIDSYEQYYTYSNLIFLFFYENVSHSLGYDDVAACVRIIADPNSRFDTVRRRNLLKIAEILEKR